MFDAKSLLEALVKGASPAPAQSAGGLGGLGDILGKMMQGGGAAATERHAAPAQGGGLDDLLRQIQGQLGGGGSAAPGRSGDGGGFADAFRNMLPGGQAQPQTPASGGGGGGLGDILGELQKRVGSGAGQDRSGRPGGVESPTEGGGLGDILGELQKRMGQGAGQDRSARPGGVEAPAQGGGGGLMDILGQILGQATSGVKEGAQRIDGATGVGRQARDAVGQATGRSPEELLGQLKEWIANNPGAAAAGAGGLGAVVLGTRTGRSVATSAAKLGALVMIGGLAYKAYQNYANGKPIISGPNFVPDVAPQGSGFEPQAVTQESAVLYIRAMIAAAAADGRIDAGEQQKILGGLKQAGLDQEAEEFLANELNNPATAADLAAAVGSPEEAVQVFTAARISVDLDTAEEHAFLVDLARRLRLDPKLVQHIDGAAQGAAA